jgi:hypothetical protein
MSDTAWWLLMIVVVRPALTVAFTSVASLSHRRGTGRWPTISQWCSAAERFHGLPGPDDDSRR